MSASIDAAGVLFMRLEEAFSKAVEALNELAWVRVNSDLEKALAACKLSPDDAEILRDEYPKPIIL